ncbi:hypothetical protein ACFCZV_13180 [Streptomyces hydrogenans]|uniref:hypothetical protein n=1 Tax=Streptomyces hydrogenans TaxID=1873719 RepID=UPI0035E2C9A7
MNTYNVTAPDQEFSGESCGVLFTEGAAVVSDEEKTGRQAIEYFRRRGYGLTPVTDVNEDSKDGGSDEGDEAFDPAAHDAAEVIEYLNALDTDDEDQDAEFGRVIDAERTGKVRKTVLALAEEG